MSNVSWTKEFKMLIDFWEMRTLGCTWRNTRAMYVLNVLVSGFLRFFVAPDVFALFAIASSKLTLEARVGSQAAEGMPAVPLGSPGTPGTLSCKIPASTRLRTSGRKRDVCQEVLRLSDPTGARETTRAEFYTPRKTPSVSSSATPT